MIGSGSSVIGIITSWTIRGYTTATPGTCSGRDATRPGLLLVGLVGGIGFTMSLFIAQLAFPPGPYLDTAKLAILAGSGAAIVTGLAMGIVVSRRRR